MTIKNFLIAFSILIATQSYASYHSSTEHHPKSHRSLYDTDFECSALASLGEKNYMIKTTGTIDLNSNTLAGKPVVVNVGQVVVDNEGAEQIHWKYSQSYNLPSYSVWISPNYELKSLRLNANKNYKESLSLDYTGPNRWSQVKVEKGRYAINSTQVDCKLLDGSPW